MSGQLLKQFASGNRTIQVILSDVVKERGYDRAIDAISAAAKEAIAERIKNAFIGSTMLSDNVKTAATTLRIV